jgi:glycine oxidase
MEYDFLLIGQGLAGSVLSFRLLEMGKKVLVFDLPAENKSSRIAAGLYNPVTGKKMVKTWKADPLFEEVHQLYPRLEKILNTQFFHPRTIYRPFLSIEEQNEWMGWSGDPSMSHYIKAVKTSSQYQNVNDPYGGILLNHSGYVDINNLLDHFASYLQMHDSLRQERFDETLLTIEGSKIYYQDIQAKALIYCNGLSAKQSRFFNDLPFAPVKGEILQMSSAFVPKEIINRGVFRISLGGNQVKLGSTYSWHDLDQGPTERAKLELFEKVDKLILNEEKEVLQHLTGIRPATKDRRPFLGKHPDYESVYIFNGFGAKGVTLIPYFSEIMINFMEHGIAPEKEVNINRFN